MPLFSERMPTGLSRPVRLYALRAGLVGLALAVALSVALALLVALVLVAATATLSGSGHLPLTGSSPLLAGQSWPLSLSFVALLGLAASGETSDVDRLIEGVRSVAGGDYDVSFELDREDDIGRLAEELEDLADAVERRERGYEEYEAFRDDLLDAVDDVFYVLDKDGAHRQWNQTFCEASGYSDDEVAEMHPLDFFEGKDRERAAAAMDEAFETGFARVEADLATADGDSIPHEWTVSRVESPDGTPVLAGVARDVSERRARQREAAESARYRQRLYEITSDPTLDDETTLTRLLELGCERLDLENGHVARIDPEAGVHDVLHAGGSSLVEAGTASSLDAGYCRETLEADGILDLQDAAASGVPNPATEDGATVRSYLGAKLYVEGELFGSLCFVDTEPRAEPFSPDEKTFVDLIARWVSQLYERRWHTRELRRKDRAMEAAPVGITIHVPDGDGYPIRYANDAFERITGYDEAAAVDEHGVAFAQVAEEDALDRVEAAMREGESITEDLRSECPDGTEYWRRVHVAPVEAPGDQPTEFVVFHEDVTDRRHYEDRLAAISESASRLEGAETEADVGETVCSIVDEVLSEPLCMLWTYDEVADAYLPVAGTEEANVLAAEVADDGPLALPADGVEAESLPDRDSFVVEDYQSVEDAAYPEAPVGTVLKVPFDGGLLAVAYRDVRDVDPGTRELVEILGKHAAASLDRVEREERLARYKEFTDDMMDSIDDLFYVLDRNLQFERWNDSVREVTGYPDEEIASMDPLELIVEDDRPEVVEAIEETFDAGSARVEARVLTSDGEELPYEFVASALVDPDGDPVLVGIGRDVGERKERERKLEALVENTTDPIYIKDPEGRYVFVNQATADYLGVDVDDVLGSTDVDIFDAGSADVVREDDREVMETGEPLTNEVTHVVDGGERVFLDLKYPYRDEDGEVVGLMGISRDITERVEYERKLEARSAAMEESIDGMAILDEDGEYVFANQAHADIYGYEDGEAFLGETWRLCYDDEVVEHIEAEIWPALQEAGSWRGSVTGQRADGSTFPQELSLTRLDDGRIICVVRDVTERTERERELQRSERQFEAVFEDPKMLVALLDLDGTVRQVNEKAFEYVQASPSDVVGEPFPEMPWWKDTPTEDVREWIERTRAGQYVEYEAYLDGPSGLRHWVSGTFRPVTDEHGDVVSVVVSAHDVTERREHEAELRETNERLSAVIEASPAAMVAMDTEGTVELWNPAAERIFGWSEDEVVGEPLPYVPEDLESELETYRERLEAGESVTNVETRRVTEDGSEVDVNLSIAPLRDSEGEVVGAMGAMLDITEQKQRQRELERNRVLLRQAQRVARIGGWELDLRADPPEMTWTDQLYDIHGVERGVEIDLERAMEFYHPDDRERIHDIVQTAIEEAEPYDMEARLDTDGEQRWIRAIAEPVEADGEVVALRGSIQEITDLKRREQELERTRDLLQQAQRMGGVGGWELDVSEEPYRGIWTDELFRIFEIEPQEPFPLEEIFEYIHPDERDWVRAEITRGIESGEPYSLEHRIVTGEGNVRWIRVVAEPVDADEELYRGAILDITEQKERELILESLHETARGLLQTDTTTEVAELAVDTAEDVLDVPCTAVYVLDDASGYLEPVAYNDGFEERCGDPAASSSGQGDTLLWEAYVSESSTSLSESAVDEPGIFEESIQESVYVPIGDHGVFVIASPDRPIDRGTRRVAETLVATMEAALHRLDSEADLRERETELASQNRRLRRQIGINEIIRSVDQSLIGASDREEIETAVCDRLTDSEDVAFAWIGALDTTGDELVPRAWAGTSHDYLDAVSLRLDAGSADPAVQTAVSGDSTVVESVVEAVKTEDWRKHALVSNFSSVVAVPIAFDDYTYGVLAVYGREPGQFGDLERAVFEELGESIANSINAVETRQALYADTFVELTVRFTDAEDFLARVAREVDAEVEYVGLGTHSEDESRVFFEVAGADPEAVLAMLEDTVAVEDHRLIGETGDRHLFEATVAGEVLAARLVRLGGVPRSITAHSGELEATVDVPATIDVREFVESLREQYPSAEMVARRDVHRDVETRQELVTSLFEELTDRQIEVLRTAYFAGFFGWPRESTGEEIAELLDVSQPTVNRHIRHGLARLLEQLFEEEPATIARAQ